MGVSDVLNLPLRLLHFCSSADTILLTLLKFWRTYRWRMGILAASVSILNLILVLQLRRLSVHKVVLLCPFSDRIRPTDFWNESVISSGWSCDTWSDSCLPFRGFHVVWDLILLLLNLLRIASWYMRLWFWFFSRCLLFKCRFEICCQLGHFVQRSSSNLINFNNFNILSLSSKH